MCDSPGFTKPTHGYGQEFPAYSPDQLLGARFDTPDQTGEVIDFEPLDEPDWAGPGFETPAGPE